ncbi:polyprenyl synthetase family protein [Deinococcus detaillensis]|uniref:Polyprenyl synthetase family protein n=1 Tax=Deinococcus detaillensis TaxID=2592048 RepID=A0A553UZK8_9DEIO|nr:polyprenyl synthetase family protein [Deinococcus detaillensis]TSA85620.1 polyprenyl synthetase family protein [Deinococcus detaillensis]
MRSDLLDLIFGLLPSTDSDRTHSHPELAQFYAMLRDYPQRGGKGLRSELLLLSAKAHGAREDTPQWQSALWLGAVLELFQNWVLIHDDIEDDSEERRGRPALHRLHGVPLALNAGDALHAYMWAAVQQAGVPGAYEEVLTMIHRTAEGQHLDLAWVAHHEWQLTEADYLEMVRLKTAYYTVVIPLRLGALAAGQLPDPAFTPAGEALGAAFQIRDDVLNLQEDEGSYGKEIGGDLLEGKRTLIVLHWLSGAPATQRAFFLSQMALPRTDKDPAQMAQVLDWIRESGSLDYAQQFASEQGRRGLSLLEEALGKAANQTAASQIIDLVQSYVTRQA